MGWAQLTSTATINGTLTDSTGALVPNAAVTAINETTGAHLETASNADGSYVFPGLEVAVYTISVTKEGFETSKVTGIALHPSVVTTINVILKVGQVVSQVTVSATLAQVQTSTSEVSHDVAGPTVATLPLNGRNYQSLSALMPGVTNLSPGVSEGPGGFLTSNTMSVNGMGTNGTLYTVDGLWDMNTGNMTQTTITPNPDTIQEVRVLQNNFSVQYGLLQSSVILLATKSGTDQFHGTAFEYLRNTDLNARNFFSATVPTLQQNIFGYTIGGPFYIPNHINSAKKRTFFFWSEQWTDQHVGNIVRGTTPTAAERQGNFGALCTAGFNASGLCTNTTSAQQLVDPFAGNAPYVNDVITTTPNYGNISAVPLALTNAVANLPNDQVAGFDNYLNQNPTINTTRDDEAKVDHNFSQRVRLMAEYLDDRQLSNIATQTVLGDPYTTSRQPTTTQNQLAQVQLTTTLSPSMVNTTSVGMNNYVVSILYSGTILQSQVPGFSETLPYPNAFEGQRLPDVTFGQGYSPMGVSYTRPLTHASDLEDTLSDDWSWLHGKHYIQAGGNLVLGTKRQDSYTQTNGVWSFSGSFTGNALADFLIGQSSTFIQTSAWPRPYDHYHIVSPYVQDQVKLTRHLSVTLGFREEFIPRPQAQVGYDSYFNPAVFNAADVPTVSPTGVITATPNFNSLNGIILNGVNGVPQNFFSNHQWFAAPSVGFAWDVFGNGKTSLRGGYGITYQRTFTSGDCSYTCAGNPPRVYNVTLNNALFPNPVGTGTAAATTIETLNTGDVNFKPAEIQSYSLSLEHQFPGNFLASIAAAGTIQRDLAQSININQALPDAPYNFNPNINFNTALNAAYTASYYGPYLGWAGITDTKAEGNGMWNALEISVRHPAGHNLMLTVAYTFQHGLNDIGSVQDSYHPMQSYGPSSNYVPQVLTFSWVYSIPAFSSAKGFEGAALGGWKYSTVSTIQGGFLNNLGMSASRAGLATRPNVMPGASTKGPKTVAEWFNTGAFTQPAPGYFGNSGPYSINGPGTVNFDMAFYKDFHIRERHKFEFRAELFNIFNIANFASLSTGYGASNFGQVTSARDPRIAEFALRYQF